MENLEIASALEEVADLLEIQGANPFRVRAYRNAVRTIRALDRPLAVMVESGDDLTELPGIGKEMAGHMRELVVWGELSVLEELGRTIPRTVADLVRLDGVGPAKARRLWEALGVTSVDELEVAISAGRVEELEGFGKKSVEKIGRAIQTFRGRQGRFLLSEADALAAPLVRYMEGLAGVGRVEIAGSYRRRQETVGNLDVLILSEERPGGVMDRVLAYPGVARVESTGQMGGRFLLRSGLGVDVRIVPGRSFGAGLRHFTGSREHNAAIRILGAERGLPTDENGEAGTEEEVFCLLGLPWIPPVLRENRGEIEAAALDDLPALITAEAIRGDLQMHSTWSDGEASIAEMARTCRERGYEYLSLTDHSQAVTVARGLSPERVRRQWEEIEEVRGSLEGIHLFRSLEVDILRDGSLDMPEDILEGLDLVLVSVHSFMGMGRTRMTDRIIRAMEHPTVDILAHPTGRILNRREPFDLDLEVVLQAAAALEVAVELNAHPSRLDLHDRHLRRAKELGVKVAISTDSHAVRELANMSYGVDQARRGWLEPSDILNCLSLDAFQEWRSRRMKR